jgi:hypothetical protein
MTRLRQTASPRHAEVRGQKTEDRDLNWEVGMRNAEFKGQRTEIRRQKVNWC